MKPLIQERMIVKGEVFHLGWWQHHITPYLNGDSIALRYVLVPAGMTGHLDIVTLDVITDTGRPAGREQVNQLQLATPRDPDLTNPGYPGPITCPKEEALIRRLEERANAAGYMALLPVIEPTQEAPAWARFPPLREFDRSRLWRALGAAL